MNRLTVIVAGLSFLASPVLSQSATPDLDAICAQRGCRDGGFDIALGIDKQRYTTIPVTRSPYVPDDSSVLIFPGETIAIQFRSDGSNLTQPKFFKRFAPELPAQIAKDNVLQDNAVNATLPKLAGVMPRDQVADLPLGTIVISYGQYKPHDGGMMLRTEHNFSQTLKFDAIISIIQKGAYDQRRTSTCGVMPGMSGTEGWAGALGPIILTNFHFLPSQKSSGNSITMTCN
jgi:hypothetical protein